MTNIKISAITSIGKNMTSIKNSAKIKCELPSMFIKKGGVTVTSLSALSMILPASKFLDKTNIISCTHDGYVQRDGQWYERHVPTDGSDYYHEVPCSNPYEKPKYYPGS